MFGRYGKRADKQRTAEWLQTRNTDVFNDSYLAPSYNVAPQSMQPVVRLDCDTGQRELTVMRWGLVSYWAKVAMVAFSTINAKVGPSPQARHTERQLRVAAAWCQRTGSLSL